MAGEQESGKTYSVSNVRDAQVLQGEHISVSIRHSFNKVRNEFDEETAKALLRVDEIVAQSGSKEATELFAGFNEELQKQQPKKTVLRSLWADLMSLVPQLGKIADLAVKISRLFGG